MITPAITPSKTTLNLLVILAAKYPAINATTAGGNNDNIYRNNSTIFIPPFYIISKYKILDQYIFTTSEIVVKIYYYLLSYTIIIYN